MNHLQRTYQKKIQQRQIEDASVHSTVIDIIDN